MYIFPNPCGSILYTFTYNKYSYTYAFDYKTILKFNDVDQFIHRKLWRMSSDGHQNPYSIKHQTVCNFPDLTPNDCRITYLLTVKGLCASAVDIFTLNKLTVQYDGIIWRSVPPYFLEKWKASHQSLVQTSS